MNEFCHPVTQSYRPLEARDFVTALNQDVSTALAEMGRKATQNRKHEIRQAWKWSVLCALGFAGLVAGFLGVMSVASPPSPEGVEKIKTVALGAAPIMVLLGTMVHWLHLNLYEDSAALASAWCQPLAESKYCEAFQSLVQKHPELSLLPQAGNPRALYVGDYQLAKEVVTAARKASEAQRQRDACASLHTQSFSGATGSAQG